MGLLTNSNKYMIFFLDRKPCNQTALSRMPSAASKAERANNLEEFMEAAAPLAGCDDLESFYKENNPMQ